MLSLPVPKVLRPVLAYSLAAASVGCSSAVRHFLPALVRPYTTFYLAVFWSAWAGGAGPGVAATLLSIVVAEYFFIPPYFDFRLDRNYDLADTAVFFVTGVLTSLLCDALRNATENSQRSAAQAKASAREAENSRERERNILESIADGFIAFDPQWRISFVNEPAAKMLGRRRAELLGKHIVSLYPSIFLGESFSPLRKAVDERRLIHFEFYDERHDRWYGSSAYPSVSGVSLFTRDVTKSRKLVEALSESEERFRIMSDSAPLLIWTGTSTGVRDYVNRLFTQFTGREFHEELGDGWLELVHPEELDEVVSIYQSAADARIGFTVEYRMRRTDGEYRWMLDSGAPRFSPRGEYLGSVGSCIDITARKRIEDSLRDSEAQLRLSMSISQMGSWSLDLHSGVMTCSPELERILGVKPATYPRTFEFLTSLVHPDDRDNFTNALTSVYASGGEWEVECRFVRPDQEIRWLLFRGQGFVDQARRCDSLAGIGIDLTDRREFNERVQHAQKLESLGILAGGVAHDFNNLLTGIMGSAGMVLDDLEPGSMGWTLQKNVLEASERAAQLTNQMLAYSGKGRFLVEQIDLARVIRDNLRLVQASLKNKKIDVQLFLAEQQCVVEADAAQIQQVIMNLMINAAEAIPEDHPGTVTVSTAVVTLGVEQEALRPGEYALVRVEDTGVGMDEATLVRIFDPFFTTKFTGRGLGLAAVQGIVRGHQGGIEVTSAPGEGSVFSVLLPRSSASATPRRDDQQLEFLAYDTILLVDDEEVVRRTATAALERFGYHVVTAEHGLRAVEIFQESPERFALILLDMTMPVMNGEEALPVLRRIRPDVKVIVSSGYSETEMMARFSGSGLESFIQKPYSSAQLAEKVRAATNGSKLRPKQT